jgi:hypothetical protein
MLTARLIFWHFMLVHLRNLAASCGSRQLADKLCESFTRSHRRQVRHEKCELLSRVLDQLITHPGAIPQVVTQADHEPHRHTGEAGTSGSSRRTFSIAFRYMA